MNAIKKIGLIGLASIVLASGTAQAKEAKPAPAQVITLDQAKEIDADSSRRFYDAGKGYETFSDKYIDSVSIAVRDTTLKTGNEKERVIMNLIRYYRYMAIFYDAAAVGYDYSDHLLNNALAARMKQLNAVNGLNDLKAVIGYHSESLERTKNKIMELEARIQHPEQTKPGDRAYNLKAANDCIDSGDSFIDDIENGRRAADLNIYWIVISQYFRAGELRENINEQKSARTAYQEAIDVFNKNRILRNDDNFKLMNCKILNKIEAIDIKLK